MLAFGQLGRAERTALMAAAGESAFDILLAETAKDAQHILEQRPLSAVLVDAQHEDAQAFALEARARAERSQLPILALTPQLDDLSFEDAYSWGADDVVKLGSTRRLVQAFRNLPRDLPVPPTVTRGAVLVAEADHTRRLVIGRVLRNAGYRVMFAITGEDAARFAASEELELIVANTEVVREPELAIHAARETGSHARWLILVPPKVLREHEKAMGTLEHVRVMDGFASPENVLFIANELMRGGGGNNRASPRLLYGTVVAFRGAGRDVDDHGFVYNISVSGLYIRTVLPPTDDLVWLELRPPRSERRVRLVGQVAWRRRLGPNQQATVPPGFGAAIVDGAQADLRAWADGYGAFAGALGMSLKPH